MDKTKRLLERGYLPAQLPPAFTSSSLAKKNATLQANWNPSRVARPNTRGDFYSIARVGHARRLITIPNPVPQVYLSNAIATYWPDLQTHLKKSRLSVSRPTMKGNARATEIMPLSELAELRLILSSASRYILRTDIARFFPTLYTHSIPWALHGKKDAKLNHRDRSPKFFGNILDSLVALTQERQTIGIPIGPDTSHVISEVIATSIDLLIKSELKHWPIGYRHVDDYFMCFDTESDANNALSAVTKALREFELDINIPKTRILTVDQLRDDDWADEIRGISIDTSSKDSQRQDIQRLFSKAFELMRRDENVLKYAVRKTQSVRILEENWELYEAYLLRCAVLSPNCLPNVVGLLTTYGSLNYALNRTRILSFCNNIIVPGARSEFHSEIVWGLWLALELKLRLSRSVTAALGNVRSGVCALVALHLRDEGLLTGSLDTALWSSFLDEAGLRGPMWMLAYEAARKQWLVPTVAGFVSNDSMFGPMDAESVSFYNEDSRIAPLIRRVLATTVDEWDDTETEVESYEFEDWVEEYAA